MKTILSAAFGLALLAVPALAHDGISIQDPYVRAMGASAKSGAVFFTIENHSDQPDRLIGASTDVSDKAELHTHKMDDKGMMQMLEVKEGFEIPAGGTHKLARGGDHVMLFGLNKTLGEGDNVHVTLTFEHAGEVEFDAPVDNNRMK
ncbi:copper chaperone PCu(A)C [Frigidibacter sp. ROC022]|uniref:copper chaperone PCu(A)C n=1 Tax=Frigidibacter sp. ROC022 TaxID=2971796 RepID=UPI00215A8BB2|nr:copper chaperone PCu(A)C [Frigidibacter sp. ROC022]MCR8722995.1 copper chaperone PCu(A)C [Frigidibacter sp. ROC022]